MGRKLLEDCTNQKMLATVRGAVNAYNRACAIAGGMTDLARRGLALFCASHGGSGVWPFNNAEQEPGLAFAPSPAGPRDARAWAPGPAISTAPIVGPVCHLEHEGFFASAMGTSPAIGRPGGSLYSNAHRVHARTAPFSRRGPTRRCERNLLPTARRTP